MPRIGMNPARGMKTNYYPSRVTIAVLTYLPQQTGYFSQRFDVTKLCIESILSNTPGQYDLLVFDNGSCPEMIDYLRGLHTAQKIRYLFLSSQNIGKIAALQFIFRSAPGEIVAYTDDDVFFLPGWLDQHLKILETYPRVGQVSGFYIRPHMSYAIDSTLRFTKEENVVTEQGLLIPREWEVHYVENTGRTWERYNDEIKDLSDIRVTYQGVQAMASAGHHQFVAYRQVVLDALPSHWSGNLMGQMRELDETIDRLGYLRLSTPFPVTRLIGNMISEEMAAEARTYGINISAPSKYMVSPLQTRIYRSRIVQAIARKIYNELFKIINT